MTLSMLESIGPERAVMYLKKLQGELKDRMPAQLWEELHPDTEGAGRNASPDMPEGWRFWLLCEGGCWPPFFQLSCAKPRWCTGWPQWDWNALPRKPLTALPPTPA